MSQSDISSTRGSGKRSGGWNLKLESRPIHGLSCVQWQISVWWLWALHPVYARASCGITSSSSRPKQLHDSAVSLGWGAHSWKDHGNVGINSFLFSRGGTDKNQGDKGLVYGSSSLSGIWSRHSMVGPGSGWSWATKSGLELTGHSKTFQTFCWVEADKHLYFVRNDSGIDRVDLTSERTEKINPLLSDTHLFRKLRNHSN